MYLFIYLNIHIISIHSPLSHDLHILISKKTPFMGVSFLHLASNAPPCLSRVRIMFCGATPRHIRITFVTCATARLGLAASFGGEIEGAIGLYIVEVSVVKKRCFSRNCKIPYSFFMSWNGRCYNSISFVRPVSRSDSSTRQRLGDSTRWKQASIFGGAVLDPSGWTVDTDFFKGLNSGPKNAKITEMYLTMYLRFWFILSSFKFHPKKY